MATRTLFSPHMKVLRRLAQGPALALVGVRREAARHCGIRQEPLESWIKHAPGDDVVPELSLNSMLMKEAFLQLLATGLGALILASAAGVVLGGFSTDIKKHDFWYITAIGIIQTAKVVSFISGPTARFFVQFPAAFIRRIISTGTWQDVDNGDVVVGVLAFMLPIVSVVAPIVTAVACYVLSMIGLVGALHHHGGYNTKRGNMKPALIVFYSLVLAQGTLFHMLGAFSIIRSVATVRFSRKYFGIGNTKGIELVDRYITDTQDKCIQKGVFSTTNRTLVSFAAELLQSEYHSDHVSAVSVLHVLTTMEKREARAVEQICSSEQVVGSLFKLLRPKSHLDLETKVDTAEILTKLSCNLRLTDIPGAVHSISSLLDPHPRLMKTAAKAGLPEPPAPGVAHQVIRNAGCPRLVIELLRKCMGLGDNEAEGEGEPSPPGETQTQTNNTNQGGAEPQSTGETQININISNSDASGPADRRPTYIPYHVECLVWLPTKFLRHISDRGGEEPAQEIQNQTTNTNEGGARDKPLIVHGLMILESLASDPGNCTEICKTTDLVPKILAPITHGLLNTLGNGSKNIQIVKASLRVVAKLTSATCESSSKLRRELVSENGRTARNIMWIMRNSSEQEMRTLAMEILTRLTLGKPRMCDVFDPLDSPPAGKAQNVLAVDLRSWEVIYQEVGNQFPALVALMNADGTSTEHRAVTAEFLAQICAKSKTDQDRMHRLSSVSNSLSKVLETIVATEMMAEKRKFLASFLCLAVQIRENLVTAEAFANAVRGLPMGNNIFSENVFHLEQDGQVFFRFIKFAEKLKKIIVEMENESEDETCLVITKATAKLVTWTMSIDPVYAHYFQQENIVDKLKDIVNNMGDLERCVVLRGDADEMKHYETLQTLAEALKSSLVAALGTAGQAAQSGDIRPESNV